MSSRGVMGWLAALMIGVLPCSAANPLGAAIADIIDGKDYHAAQWGILVADAKTGETIWARHADKLIAPASVTKLYSSAAILAALGADYRFQTPLYRTGGLRSDGTLIGNLVIVASGDPTFGGRTLPNGRLAFQNQDHTYANAGLFTTPLTQTNPVAALDHFAKLVRRAGITAVQGDILIDASLFEPTHSTGSGPDLVTPMMVNDNVVDLIVSPGPHPGAPAIVRTRPETAYLQLDTDITTGEKVSSTLLTLRTLGGNRATVRGQIPLGSQPLVRIVPVEDPIFFARALFIESLRRHGVRVSASLMGPVRAQLPRSDDYGGLPLLGVYTSPPLSELLKVTLKVSHNLYASAFPCLIAAHAGKRTAEEGLRLQANLLEDLGVSVKTISFGGGAGGAAADFVTPHSVIQLLRGMASRPDWPIYRDALPVMGVDGTLSEVLPPHSPAQGKIHAKTGTLITWNQLNDRGLLRSKALAGTMTTASGRDVHFALFVNGVTLPVDVDSSREGKVLAQLAELIYHQTPAGELARP
ncbi:MAG: D-alanyl-D-alanine carboxypeptidase/D-alanyl-D-alanine-endopeptidase [Bacteroidales bacterium]|nr:D-alanyl-D-alanine carboxypeptidase/D-alanyl-D-alanine-endopeptidase [Bacteroidales bacterium]